MSDSIISFRSPVFALTTKQERVHHPVVSTPATIQLLRNHSCSGSVLRLYFLIVRGAEPNPSRPPQPRQSAAGPLEVTCWGQSRAKARLFLWRPVFSAAHQHSHLSQQKGTIVKRNKKLTITTRMLVSLLRLLQKTSQQRNKHWGWRISIFQICFKTRRRLRLALWQKQVCEFLFAHYVVCLCEHMMNCFSWECISQWKTNRGKQF